MFSPFAHGSQITIINNPDNIQDSDDKPTVFVLTISQAYKLVQENKLSLGRVACFVAVFAQRICDDGYARSWDPIISDDES